MTDGRPSLTATDTATGTITGSQSSITINPAAASRLVLSDFPSAITVLVAAPVTVTAQDPYGNTATGYSGTVHFSSSDILALLPANYTFVAADAGVHSFSVTLISIGTQSLTVTDTVIATITGSLTGITARVAGSNAWLHPELVTISFVPDGTLMTSGSGGNVYSNLFAKLNAKF